LAVVCAFVSMCEDLPVGSDDSLYNFTVASSFTANRRRFGLRKKNLQLPQAALTRNEAVDFVCTADANKWRTSTKRRLGVVHHTPPFFIGETVNYQTPILLVTGSAHRKQRRFLPSAVGSTSAAAAANKAGERDSEEAGVIALAHRRCYGSGARKSAHTHILNKKTTTQKTPRVMSLRCSSARAA
jgi:hypothetical protein